MAVASSMAATARLKGLRLRFMRATLISEFVCMMGVRSLNQNVSCAETVSWVLAKSSPLKLEVRLSFCSDALMVTQR